MLRDKRIYSSGLGITGIGSFLTHRFPQPDSSGQYGLRGAGFDELGNVLAVVAVAALDRQVALLELPDRGGHRLRREDADDPDDPDLLARLRRPQERLRGACPGTP